MASQRGAVTVPPSVLQKLDKGLPCTEDEQFMVDAMPGAAVQLLKNIPMLTDGLVLTGRGMIVTELLLDGLTNFARMIGIVEPVLAVPGASARY